MLFAKVKEEVVDFDLSAKITGMLIDFEVFEP